MQQNDGASSRFNQLRTQRLGQMRGFVIAELKGVLKELSLKTSGLKGELQQRIEVLSPSRSPEPTD